MLVVFRVRDMDNLGRVAAMPAGDGHRPFVGVGCAAGCLEIELDPRIPAKTSMVFTTPHREGALAHCLNLLAEHKLNLTKLESRPVPQRPWEYLFYVDIEGSLDSDSATIGIAALRRECPYLRVFGSYPARTTAAGAVDRYNGSES